MPEKTTEELIRQNKRYRETLIIFVCVIVGFMAGILFDRTIQDYTMSQSAKLGGIVVNNIPYEMKRMISKTVMQGDVVVSANKAMSNNASEKK